MKLIYPKVRLSSALFFRDVIANCEMMILLFFVVG